MNEWDGQKRARNELLRPVKMKIFNILQLNRATFFFVPAYVRKQKRVLNVIEASQGMDPG